MSAPRQPQLDQAAIDLVHARIAVVGSIAAVARELGIARTGLSMALAGRYPAGTDRLRDRIVRRYANRIPCPHLGRDIAPDACVGHRERPLPTGPRAAIDHWRACRRCPNNPDRRPELADLPEEPRS